MRELPFVKGHGARNELVLFADPPRIAGLPADQASAARLAAAVRNGAA